MKKSIFGRIAAITLVLSVITTCLLGRTLSAFMNSGNAEMTVAVAKFDAEAALSKGDGSALANMNLADSKDENAKVKEGKVAPGDKGTIKLELNFANVETAAKYDITAVFGSDNGNTGVFAMPALLDGIPAACLDVSKIISFGPDGYKAGSGAAYTCSGGEFKIAENVVHELKDDATVPVMIDWKMGEDVSIFAADIDSEIARITEAYKNIKGGTLTAEDQTALDAALAELRASMEVLDFQDLKVDFSVMFTQVLPTD